MLPAEEQLETGTATADPCRICASSSVTVGVKQGTYRRRDYHIRRCVACGFVWVADPDTDYEQLYDERYYRGLGADPLIDYLDELESPASSIRRFEWQGILEVVSGLTRVDRTTSWLDFGCGNGGLVRFVGNTVGCDVFGYDQGWITDRARANGIQIAHELPVDRRFDIVTAIEVMEHVADPVATLRQIRSVLKPGGLFFMTTGNVAPFAGDVLRWSYLRPEIHISLYTPGALDKALARSGFTPQRVPFNAGFDKIYAFKVLKNLGFKTGHRWQSFVPWSIAARLLERRFKLQQHPVGWAAGM
jgi:SAM-dependent methyltransferase